MGRCRITRKYVYNIHNIQEEEVRKDAEDTIYSNGTTIACHFTAQDVCFISRITNISNMAYSASLSLLFSTKQCSLRYSAFPPPFINKWSLLQDSQIYQASARESDPHTELYRCTDWHRYSHFHRMCHFGEDKTDTHLLKRVESRLCVRRVPRKQKRDAHREHVLVSSIESWL